MIKMLRNREAPAAETATPAFTPTQTIDYTSLPVVDEAGPLDRLRAMPARLKALLAVGLLVLIGAGTWAFLEINKPAPVVVAPPPVTQLVLDSASVTSERAIAVTGTVANATDGMTVTAQLLQDGQPISWVDSGTASTQVSNGKVELRLERAQDWAKPLAATAAYSVALLADGVAPATVSLDIPAAVSEAFYRGGEVVAVAPATPEPTAEPTPEPTVAPTAAPAPAAGPPTLTTGATATLLVSPSLGSGVLTTLAPNIKIEPAMRTGDNKFFLIIQDQLVGWLPAEQAIIDPNQVGKVKLVTPAPGASHQGPLTADVFNGGNIRYRPSKQTGTVLGQMIAGQTVTLKEKLANGSWYHVVAPNAEGWVARDLLTIDPKTIAAVPIAK